MEIDSNLLQPEVHIGTTPQPVTVTTRILPFLVGNPCKPSFVTVAGWVVDLRYTISKDQTLKKENIIFPMLIKK